MVKKAVLILAACLLSAGSIVITSGQDAEARPWGRGHGQWYGTYHGPHFNLWRREMARNYFNNTRYNRYPWYYNSYPAYYNPFPGYVGYGQYPYWFSPGFGNYRRGHDHDDD